MRLPISIAAACAGLTIAFAWGSGIAAPRLTRAEIDDPLEPWSLEAGPTSRAPFQPAPGPEVTPRPEPGTVPEPALPFPGIEQSQEPDAPNAGERVVVVRCRQILVSDPSQAARLAALLRSGLSAEAARRALDGVDFEERTREYAIDELEPDIRSEIEALPEGGWSRVRSWRGRSLLYQVVSKGERTRGSVPKLGAGLGSEEQGRLSRNLQSSGQANTTASQPTAPNAPRPGEPPVPPTGQAPPGGQQTPAPPEPGVELAAVTEPKVPEYPAGITKSGTVVVSVEIGVLGEVIEARVVSSTDPVFDPSALDAARHQTYKAKTRNGIPEKSTLTLTFEFRAPQD